MTPLNKTFKPFVGIRDQAGIFTFPGFALFAFNFLIVTFLFSCSKKSDDVVTPNGGSATGSTIAIDSTTKSSATAEGNTYTAADEEDILANSTFSSTVRIVFGSTITITNPLAANGVTITETNGDVVIDATVAEVEYILSGSTTNGSVKIYSEKKFKLTLNGVNITNADGPAINIQSGKRAFIVLNDNTINTLTDGATYTASGEEDMKGTFFSEGQLIFSGNGSLGIKGNYKHGIASDDYVRIVGGNITVTGAVSDGIHSKDAFIADGGTINITASNDGIQCDEGFIVINGGTFTVNVVDKGISASYDTDTTIDPYIVINGGSISVISSAGEGIESKSVITINDGTITARTKDDGINAKAFIYINGGNIYAYSTSNDAIDSNGKITVTGGRIIAVGSTSPEEGFDCDRNTFKITGGIMVGVAGSSSSPTASVSTQPSVLLGGGTANQLVHIESADGAEVLTFLIPRTYSTMLFSSPKMQTGKTYNVYTGGSVANATDFNGLYTSGTYTLGTLSKTYTTAGMVTSAGGSQGPG